MRKFIIISTLLSLIFTINLLSNNKFVLEGKIIDKLDSKFIPGASIRVVNTNRGTYSSSKGKFRLYVSKGDVLLIRSVGYSELSYKVDKSKNNIEIKLESLPIETSNVDVTAEITASQIIERVVRNRDENISKMRTFSGELYSKMVMEMGGSLLSLSSNSDENTLSAMLSSDEKEVSDSKKFRIMETYSSVMKDYEKKVRKTTILKRRQTANIPSQDNIMAIAEFINFYDDEINLINTKIPSPIGKNALSSYEFTITSKIEENGLYIYTINVSPNSNIYPRFIGSLRVVEGTYDVIDIDLKPSDGTIIPFFTNINVKQKYIESLEKIWYPSFLDISASLKVDVIKGLAEFSTNIDVTSIFSDVKINQALPDSIYIKDTSNIINGKVRRITVSKLADEKDSTFWQNNSLRELSPKESEIYARVDSAVKKDSISSSMSSTSSSRLGSNLAPYIDFNRVSSVSLGISASNNLFGFETYGTGYYSFGLKDFFGNIGLKLPTFSVLDLPISIGAEAYSNQSDFGSKIGAYPRFYNSIAAAMVHEDYFDYYQKDGFATYLTIQKGNFKFNISADFNRQFSLNKTTNRSIFESYSWRSNPQIIEGNYQVLSTSINYGAINNLMLIDGFKYEINLDAFYGREDNLESEFKGASGRFSFVIPTFSTGYQPMSLLLTLSAGINSTNTPIQYQNRMAERLFALNNKGNFYSAPLGEYGGDKFYSVQASYNLSDLLWRWLGLPTYEGRGIDLVLGGTWGVFENSTQSRYLATSKDGYSEIGFGFSRIPTFVSNVIYWAIDWRFGIGEEAKGRHGGAVSITLPF